MSKSSNVKATKVPGESGEIPANAAEVESAEASLDDEVGDGSDVAVPEDQRPKMVTLSTDQLQALVAAEVAKGIKAHNRAKLDAAKPGPANLPDQSEIDAHAITKPVLTKQGYVVNPKAGDRPTHLKNLI